MNTNAQNSSSSLSARNLENKQILETYFLNDSILDISSAIENIEYLRTVINSCFACQSKEEVSIFCKLLYKTLELPLDDRLDIMSAYNNQIMFMDSRSSFWILRASTFKKDGGNA